MHKTVLGRYGNNRGHWVGDGFPVRSLFSYHTLGQHSSPFLLLARFAGILPKELVAERANEQLKRVGESRQKLDDVLNTGGCSPADRWVIDYGRSVLDVAEKYLRTHMHELTELANTDPRRDAAE